jgi:tetratricopeptide (TPR) repeat protein
MGSPLSHAGRIARTGVRVVVTCAFLTSCSAPAPPADVPITAVRIPAFRVLGAVEKADFVGSAIAASLARNLETVPVLRVLDATASAEAGTAELAGEFRRGDSENCLEVRARVAGRNDPLWSVSRCSSSARIPDLIDDLAQACVKALGLKQPARYPFIGHLEGRGAMAASPLLTEARAQFLESDYVELSKSGSELVRLFPSEPDAHAIRAWAVMLAWDASPSAANLSALKDELDTLKSLDPNSPYGDVMLAYVYRSSGGPDEARQLYTRVLARNDLTPAASSWVLRQRSYTYLQTGQDDAARRDAEEAARLDPADASTLVPLSKALEEIGDLHGALARALEAVALEPGSWRNLQRVGLVATRAGYHDQAVDYLGRACEVGGTQEACANLAVALQRAGRGGEALRIAAQAEAKNPTQWGAYNLACLWALHGDRNAALAALRRAFELGFADVTIATDPDLESLRGDARFKAEVAKVLGRIQVRRSIATGIFPWQA